MIKSVPKQVESITIVLPSPQRQAIAPVQDSLALSGVHLLKKRKDRYHKKDCSFSRCSPRLSTTSKDRAIAIDFLKYDVMISNRINVWLNNYEAGPYSATTSASDLHTTFLELSTSALLVSQIMGDKLIKKDNEDVEKLKANLASSSTSLKAMLLANINLAGSNKDLEDKLEWASAEVALLHERCSVVEQKEKDANKRADDLYEEVAGLKEELSELSAGTKIAARKLN